MWTWTTPSEVTLTGLQNTINYSVRQGISYDKDVFSLSTRYKPLHLLTLYANYEFSRLERKEVAEWDALPPKTKIHTIDLTAQAKPLDRVTVKAKYEYKNYDQPAYNTTPDKSNKLKLTTSYTPLSNPERLSGIHPVPNRARFSALPQQRSFCSAGDRRKRRAARPVSRQPDKRTYAQGISDCQLVLSTLGSRTGSGIREMVR